MMTFPSVMNDPRAKTKKPDAKMAATGLTFLAVF
jgi:hypothetical protein